MLHGRASKMDVVIVEPNTSISALSLNLCLSHSGIKSENGKIINLNRKNRIIETGSGGKDSIV